MMVVAITMTTLGCTDPPRPPASDIPKIVMDYDPDLTDHTIIYIHGIGETRYDSITLKIDEYTAVVKNNSFSLEYNTNRTELNLVAELWLDNNFYYYNATYNLVLMENVVYEITYYDGRTRNVRYVDLPYSERFTKVVIDLDE